FFFSSRRRHTRLVSDWSSDVCSSDLPVELEHLLGFRDTMPPGVRLAPLLQDQHLTVLSAAPYQALREALALNTFQRLDGVPWPRSEERRVGKECRGRGAAEA